MPPLIDGNVTSYDGEWNGKNTTTGTIEGLGITIRVGYNATNSSLYFLIELELENHQPEEFIGILLYNSSDSNQTNFIDAKIIQNYDLTGANSENHQSVFKDLHRINDTDYTVDSVKNGNGSCKLDENWAKYEFEINFNVNNTDSQDAVLNISEYHAVKFIYGHDDDYNSGHSSFKVSDTLKIKIGYVSETEIPPETLTELAITITAIISFIFAGTLYGYWGYYIYKTDRRRKGGKG